MIFSYYFPPKKCVQRLDIEGGITDKKNGKPLVLQNLRRCQYKMLAERWSQMKISQHIPEHVIV